MRVLGIIYEYKCFASSLLQSRYLIRVLNPRTATIKTGSCKVTHNSSQYRFYRTDPTYGTRSSFILLPDLQARRVFCTVSSRTFTRTILTRPSSMTATNPDPTTVRGVRGQQGGRLEAHERNPGQRSPRFRRPRQRCPVSRTTGDNTLYVLFWECITNPRGEISKLGLDP